MQEMRHALVRHSVESGRRDDYVCVRPPQITPLAGNPLPYPWQEERPRSGDPALAIVVVGVLAWHTLEQPAQFAAGSTWRAVRPVSERLPGRQRADDDHDR